MANSQELFDFYKRVEVKNLGKLTDEDLLARLGALEQALCIVNTRDTPGDYSADCKARGIFIFQR